MKEACFAFTPVKSVPAARARSKAVCLPEASTDRSALAKLAPLTSASMKSAPWRLVWEPAKLAAGRLPRAPSRAALNTAPAGLGVVERGPGQFGLGKTGALQRGAIQRGAGQVDRPADEAGTAQIDAVQVEASQAGAIAGVGEEVGLAQVDVGGHARISVQGGDEIHGYGAGRQQWVARAARRRLGQGQVRVAQVRILKGGARSVGLADDHAVEAGRGLELEPDQLGAPQVGAIEHGPADDRVVQPGTAQVERRSGWPRSGRCRPGWPCPAR